MRIVGVDPGLTGGLAHFDTLSSTRAVWPMPTREGKDGNQVDVNGLFHILDLTRPDMFIIERQQVRFAKGAMTNGMNLGRILAVLEMNGYDYMLVNPNQWQAAMPGVQFKSLSREGRKGRAIQLALDNGFDIPTLRPNGNVLHDGCADAACIALYGSMALVA